MTEMTEKRKITDTGEIPAINLSQEDAKSFIKKMAANCELALTTPGVSEATRHVVIDAQIVTATRLIYPEVAAGEKAFYVDIENLTAHRHNDEATAKIAKRESDIENDPDIQTKRVKAAIILSEFATETEALRDEMGLAEMIRNDFGDDKLEEDVIAEVLLEVGIEARSLPTNSSFITTAGSYVSSLFVAMGDRFKVA
jgi:hypothetical protein